MPYSSHKICFNHAQRRELPKHHQEGHPCTALLVTLLGPANEVGVERQDQEGGRQNEVVAGAGTGRTGRQWGWGRADWLQEGAGSAVATES